MSFWYIASPYSKFPDGIEAAFQAVCREVGLLIRAGVPVFSPIAHTHPVAMACDIDPFDHSIWLPSDAPMMEAAHGIIVCKLERWEKSYGVTHELERFRCAHKPVVFMTPGIVPNEVLP